MLEILKILGNNGGKKQSLEEIGSIAFDERKVNSYIAK